MEAKVIAIDFDGTLFENAYPSIGRPRWDVIKWAISARQCGHHVVLWTCREGKELQEAVEACASCGLLFDGINAIPVESWEKQGTPVYRKLFADLYVDDRAVSPEEALIKFQF